MKNKRKVLLVDTSAILSGKPINLDGVLMATTPAISSELKPGGRDYRNFVFLQEKEVDVLSPSKKSINKIEYIAEKTGDMTRLSSADIEILALAIDINKDTQKEAIILTDDYSIQNIANILNIKFQSFSQKGITKKFKWQSRCPGCGKRFNKSIKICPVCGTPTRIVPYSQQDINEN